jgi:hypothetical protein
MGAENGGQKTARICHKPCRVEVIAGSEPPAEGVLRSVVTV